MIDWARVTQLRDEIGAEDFAEVVELFLEEVDDAMFRLKAGGDLAQLEQDLHFLKGSALNLGFSAFSELCQMGERMASSGQAAEVDMQAIFKAYDASRDCFVTEMPEKLAA